MNSCQKAMLHSGGRVLIKCNTNNDTSDSSTLANSIHRYQVHVKGIDAVLPLEQGEPEMYKEGDLV